MNIQAFAFTILVAAANGAAATGSAASSDTALGAVTVTGARVVVDCRNERLPSQRAVGEVLDTNNGSRIYAERERLVHYAHRECLRGAASVTFLRDMSAQVPALAMVNAATTP
jgi:hypothetical protein